MLKGVVIQIRVKNFVMWGFLLDGNLSLWLSYYVFNVFNFDFYVMIWSQVIDQGSVRFYVVIGVVGNWVRFVYIMCGDFVRWNIFGDQVINNRLSMFFGQILVVSVRIDMVSEVQNDNGIVFWIQVVQLVVQLIQSLLVFWFQGRFVEVEQYVRFQSEVFGLYFWSWSWCWSDYWSSFLLVEMVGNIYVQQVVVWMGVDGVGIIDVVSLLVFQMGCDFRGDGIFDIVCEYWGNVGVVVFSRWVVRDVRFGVCMLYYIIQMGINVQIVSDWIIQFSG